VKKAHSAKASKPKPASRLLASKSPRWYALVAVCGLAVAVGIYVVYRSFAAAGTLSLSPATGTPSIGSNFTVAVRVDSSTDTINAVQADLTFPTDKLEFVSLDTATSAFSVGAAGSGNNTNGTVTIARGTSGGTSVTGSQLLANVTFKAVGTGAATINFANSSAVVRSTDNTDILTIKTPGTYTIADSTAPTAPTGLTVGTRTATSINFTWTAATDNVAVTGYRIYRNGTQVGTSATASFSDTSLTPSTSYSYTVAAVDAVPNVSAQSSASSFSTLADTAAPSVPAAPTLSTRTVNSITLTWVVATDNVAVTGYRIYRNGTQVGTSATNSFANTGLTPNTAYTFTVASYDAVPNVSAQSSGTSLSTLADTTAPTTPTGLSSPVKTTTSVSLSWAASTDNVAVTGYRIYRNGTQVGTSATTSFTDSTGGLVAGTNYSYTVAAVDAVPNVSSQSTALVITPYRAGDINKADGVNVIDLSILLSNFGLSRAAATNPDADIDGNNVIDIFDLSTLLANFGLPA
jgi:cellulose 1,4-beta-cellobiosidase